VGGACGCLLTLGIFALVIGIFAIVLGAIKDSDLYQDSLAQVRGNEQAVQALGEPIEAGWWVGGSMETSGSSGYADFYFPVSGSRASGNVYVVANKSAGLWKFQRVELAVEGQSARIPLLGGR
jgi:hypothetical protein